MTATCEQAWQIYIKSNTDDKQLHSGNSAKIREQIQVGGTKCLPCQQNDDADDDENGEGVTGAEEAVGVVQLGDAVLHQLHVGGAEPAGTPATSGHGGGLQRR